MDTILSFLRSLHFRRNAIWMVPLIFTISFPLWSIPVGNFLTPRGEDKQTAKKPTQKRQFNLQGVRITLNKDGRQTAFILAADARTDSSGDVLLMTDVVADMYDKEGKKTQINAKQGKYNDKSQMLVLQQDVVIHKTADKQTLYTQLLYFNNIKQTVHCPQKTRIITPDAAISGGSLDYNIQSATYELGKPVQCEITNFEDNSSQPKPAALQPASEY